MAYLVINELKKTNINNNQLIKNAYNDNLYTQYWEDIKLKNNSF